MELVIKLPDNLVESIKCATNNWSCSNPVLDQAIKNGIVLPKGHGDLIDRNKLKPDVFHDWDGLYVPNDDYSEKCIRNAEVVVPADK